MDEMPDDTLGPVPCEDCGVMVKDGEKFVITAGSDNPKEFVLCSVCVSKRVLGYPALKAAGNALYDAAHWTADRDVDAAALWEALRDALGREPGTAPQPCVEASAGG